MDGGGGYKTAKIELRFEAFSFGSDQRTPAQMVKVGQCIQFGIANGQEVTGMCLETCVT